MGGKARPERDLIGRSSVVARAAIGLIVLLGACSSETLTPHGNPGSGGATGGRTGGSSGGSTGQAGGSGGVGGDLGGAGEPGSIGSTCLLSSDCFVGNYCNLDDCRPSYGFCRALGTDGSGGCDPTTGPVCGCDGQPYANLCDAYNNGTSAVRQMCALPVGTPCLASNFVGCGLGAFCETAVCGDAMGTCQTTPDLATCTDPTGDFCACDGSHFSSACAAASQGENIRNAGPCPPLPSGPCSSQADCGGDSYLGQVSCVPNGCNSPAGTCTPAGDGCILLLGAGGSTSTDVCGCDGQTYYDACSARAGGVTIAYPGDCTDAGTSL